MLKYRGQLIHFKSLLLSDEWLENIAMLAVAVGVVNGTMVMTGIGLVEFNLSSLPLLLTEYSAGIPPYKPAEVAWGMSLKKGIILSLPKCSL